MLGTQRAALAAFGALAALGVTVWLLLTAPVAPGAGTPPVVGMGALGVVGGGVLAAARGRLRLVGLACGVALLVLALTALGDAGAYYLPLAMLLVAMGLAALRGTG